MGGPLGRGRERKREGERGVEGGGGLGGGAGAGEGRKRGGVNVAREDTRPCVPHDAYTCRDTRVHATLSRDFSFSLSLSLSVFLSLSPFLPDLSSFRRLFAFSLPSIFLG